MGCRGIIPRPGCRGSAPATAPQRKTRKHSERRRRNAVRLQTEGEGKKSRVQGGHLPAGVWGRAPQTCAAARSPKAQRAPTAQCCAAANASRSLAAKLRKLPKLPAQARTIFSQQIQPLIATASLAQRNPEYPATEHPPVPATQQRPPASEKGDGISPIPHVGFIRLLQTTGDYSVLKRPSAASPMAVKKSSTYLVVLFLASSKS